MKLRIPALAALLASSMVAQTPSQDAREALAKGDYARAVELYTALVREARPSAELLSNLGMALHLQGKSSEAIRVLERAVSIRELPPALAMLGVDYCKLREFDRAADVLRRARRYASDMDVMNTLGPCYLEAGDPMDAVLVYQDLVDRAVAPEDENEAGLARAYFRASKHYLDQLEKAPRNREYLEAIEQARRNSSPNARGAFPLAVKEAPYVHVGMSFADFGTLLRQHPNEAPLLYLVGVLSGERAMEAFQDCDRRFPKSAAVRRLYADMLRLEGRVEAAAAEYRLIEDFASLAKLYREAGDWENALESFRALALQHPEDERALVGIGEALQRLGRFAELERQLEPVLHRPHPPEWALLYRAKTGQALGKITDAIHYLEIAAKEYPSSQVAHYRLSQAYKLANRPELAAREARTLGQLKQQAK